MISESQEGYFDYCRTAPAVLETFPFAVHCFSEKHPKGIFKMHSTYLLQTKKVIYMEKNMPEKKFRAGAISATVWKNQSKEGNDFSSVSFEKGYKDAKGEWKSTSHLNVNDLPKALVVIGKAFEHLSLKED